jgi:hypothetical protein
VSGLCVRQHFRLGGVRVRRALGPCVEPVPAPQCPIWVATVRYYVLVWYLKKCAREWTLI